MRTKRKQLDRATAMRAHTMKRFKERFGKKMSMRLYKLLLSNIQNGLVYHLMDQTNTKSIFVMPVYGTTIVLCYNTKYHAISTVTPTYYVENIRTGRTYKELIDESDYKLKWEKYAHC